MAKLLMWLVRMYRYCISPLLGECCRFTPSCSEFALESLRRYGALTGSWMAIRRVLRCHPWHRGGFDPVP